MEFESSYEEGSSGPAEYSPKQQGEVKDMHYDEAYDVGDSEGEEVESNPSQTGPRMQEDSFQNSEDSNQSGTRMNKQAFAQHNMSGSEDAAAEIVIKGAYDPAEYQGLAVSSEIKELFQYIQRFKPQHMDLPTKMRPHVPEFIPSVGEVDAFLKVPRPDGAHEDLGLLVLDEPKLNQTDPAVLELQLKSFVKPRGNNQTGAVVRSIDNADKNPRQITKWINSIAEVQRNKPQQSFKYTKNMPDIDTLMDVWHPDVEEALNHLELPAPELEIDIGSYIRIVCAILEIPVHNLPNNKSMIESLHILFTLYNNFKTNQHFRQNMDYENTLDNSKSAF